MRNIVGAIKAIVALVLGLLVWEAYWSLLLTIGAGHRVILFFN